MGRTIVEIAEALAQAARDLENVRAIRLNVELQHNDLINQETNAAANVSMLRAELAAAAEA